MENELDFYTRRVGEELRAAAAATHPEAQLRHRKLAEEYAARAQETGNQAGEEADPVPMPSVPMPSPGT